MGEMMKAIKTKPKVKWGTGYKFFVCFITGLLWGTLAGSLGLSLLVASKMDAFYEKIVYLEHTIDDKNEKLDKLEKSINNTNIVLKDIAIILEFINLSKEQIDIIDNIEIEKAIKEKYASSLGKEIKNMDVDMFKN